MIFAVSEMLMRTKLLFLLLSALYSVSLHAQQSPVVNNFKAQHSDGVVYLDWELSSGSVCYGIGITRSIDSVNFIQIGYIPGICGSLSSPVEYYYQDQNPIANQKMYYRLELGTAANSEIISLFIPRTGKGEYNLYPNPVTANSQLYFFNPGSEPYLLKVFDSRGMEFISQTGSTDHFEISKQQLSPGLYYFILYRTGSETDLIKGNFFVY
jgi:hypothetical protein